MANNVCPDCGRPLDTLSQNGVTLKTCGCGYQFNTNTGEEMRFATNDPSFVVLCPECSGMNRIYYKKNQVQGLQAPCAFCGTTLRVPEKPDPSIRDWAVCPHCSGKNRVPVNKGTLQVKCSHCSGQFRFDSGKWPETARQTAQPKAQAQPKAAPKAKPQAEAPKAASKTHPKQDVVPKKPGFFSQMRANAEERRAKEAAEIEAAKNSFLIYLFGMKLIEMFRERDFYDTISDPGFGGIDFDVYAEGFHLRFFTNRGYDIPMNNPDITFKGIKERNREEWGADMIDKEFDRLEFPAARKAMRTQLLMDYVGRFPYLDVDVKIGRVTFNGAPYRLN